MILNLQVVDKHKLEHGAQVTWVLAAELVDVLPDPDLQQTPPQNTLRCRLVEVLALGETSICSLQPLLETGIVGGAGSDAVRLTLTLSSAHLRGLALQKDATVWVHIPPASIHIMPMRP